MAIMCRTKSSTRETADVQHVADHIERRAGQPLIRRVAVNPTDLRLSVTRHCTLLGLDDRAVMRSSERSVYPPLIVRLAADSGEGNPGESSGAIPTAGRRLSRGTAAPSGMLGALVFP